MIVTKLPYPISANRYWRPVKIGAHITIVPTKEAKAYKAEVAYLLKAAGVKKPIEGRVHIHIDLFPNRPLDYKARMRKHGEQWDDTVQCIDLDNARKVLYDAFKGVAIVDDKWIFSDSATRREPDGEARVVVTIEPIRLGVAQRALELPALAEARAPSLFDPLEV